MRKPTNNPITMPFGATTEPYTPSSPHRGTDFSYQPDDTIYAPFSGKVTQTPNNGNDGNGTYMTDPQGRFHGFLHASRYLVANQSQVQEGQPIAVMGSTGYAFGKHLHWAVRENNKFIDPISLISEESKEEDMQPDLATKGDVINRYKQILGREEKDVSEAEIKIYEKLPIREVYDALLDSEEFKNRISGDAGAAQDKLDQIKKIVT